MTLTRRTSTLTPLRLATVATLAACSSKSKGGATEEGKTALVVLDADEATAETLSKVVGAFIKGTKAEVDVKPISNVSRELACGITAEPSIDIIVLDPTRLSSYVGVLHPQDKGAAIVKGASPALLTSATWQEKITAAPRDIFTLALYVNILLRLAAGLSESDHPIIWEQLDQMAARLTSGSVVDLTLGASYTRVGAFLV